MTDTKSVSFSSHWETSGIRSSWHLVEPEGEPYIIRDKTEGTVEMYHVVGDSRNVRALAHADAVLYKGMVATTHYNHETRSLRFQHDYAGHLNYRSLVEFLDDPVPILDYVPRSNRLCEESESRAQRGEQ